MKNCFIVSLLFYCLVTIDTNGQGSFAINEKVKIVNSGSRAVVLLANYFNDDITNEILKQVSPARLMEIKKYSNEASYPSCIKGLLDEDDENELFEYIKAYRIAKFDNVRNGENFGEQSILHVPASENQNLNGSDCVFEDSFYIIIYSKDIEMAEE